MLLTAAVLVAAIFLCAAFAQSPWAVEERLWRNVAHEPPDHHVEMASIDSMVTAEQLSESAPHIRALISRFDREASGAGRIDKPSLTATGIPPTF